MTEEAVHNKEYCIKSTGTPHFMRVYLVQFCTNATTRFTSLFEFT